MKLHKIRVYVYNEYTAKNSHFFRPRGNPFWGCLWNKKVWHSRSTGVVLNNTLGYHKVWPKFPSARCQKPCSTRLIPLWDNLWGKNVIAKQHLVWRDTPNPDTPSLPSFRCSAFLKQLIGHRLYSTSQYIKGISKNIVNFPSKMDDKVYNDLLNYLSSDPDNGTWPSYVKVPISFITWFTRKI